MAKKSDFDRLKSKLETVRKDSVELVSEANRIVLSGVQKIADRELSALNDYYKAALASLKEVRGQEKNLRDIAIKQLDLLQESANQVIGHAREAVGIVAETRAKLADLLQKGVKEGESAAQNFETEAKAQVGKAADAIGKVRKAVEDGLREAGSKVAEAVPEVKAAIAKVVPEATAAAAAVAKSGKKSAKAAAPKAAEPKAAEKPAKAKTPSSRGTTRRLGSVLDLQPIKAVLRHTPPMKPSPNSRASRATSKAKRGGSED